MNDISTYLKMRPLIRTGDVIAFAGVAAISHEIDAFSGSNISHVAIVRQCGIVESPAAAPVDVMLSESTIEAGKSGPQTNPLGSVLANYGDGAQAWWLPLSDEVRALVDWKGFYATIGAADGIVKYDIPGLFGFLARQLPVIGPRVFQTENQKQMVCSAYVVDVLTGAGVLRGVNYSKMSPQDVVSMRLYSRCVQLMGKPGTVSRFNTI